jgi:uncharacterized protein
MRRWRRMMRRGKVLFLRILRINDSSSRLALGAAVGIFVAMTPTIGLQMLIVLLLLLVIPGNKAAGLPVVWITNPATMVPLYTFNYWVGAKLTGQANLRDIKDNLRAVIDHYPGIRAFFASPGEWLADLQVWFDLVWTAMKDVMMPLWVGSLVVGLVAGATSYVIFYYLIEFYRRKLRIITGRLVQVAIRRAALRSAAAKGTAAVDADQAHDAEDRTAASRTDGRCRASDDH